MVLSNRIGRALNMALKEVEQAEKPNGEMLNIEPQEQPTTEEWITPPLAREYLDSQFHNRNIRPAHVDNLAHDMSKGRWRLTHQGIAFAWDDEVKFWRLVDGQHRLLAIIKSGTTQKMKVTRGVPMPAIKDIDAGMIRTNAHYLQFEQRKHATLLSATATLLGQAELAWSKNYRLNSAGSKAMTREDLAIIIGEIDELVDTDHMARLARSVNKKGQLKLRPAVVAAFYCLVKRYAPEDVDIAETFLNELIGINTGPGRAAWVFANKYEDFKKTRPKSLETLALVLTAYRRKIEAINHGKEENVTLLKLRADNTLPEVPRRKHQGFTV